MKKILVFTMVSFCLFFNSCTNKNVYNEYLLNDLGKPISDTLKADNVGGVTGVEILLVGEVNGEATLEFENGSGRFNKIKLKGKINQIYETEWYSPKMYFKYTPISAIQGDNLKLRYRMY